MPGVHSDDRAQRADPAARSGSATERADRPARRRSAKRRAGNIAIVVILVVVFVVAAYIVAAPAMDDADQQWVTCEAYSAKPVLAGSRTSQWAVEISSSCGVVWFDNGVGSHNAAKIAREFMPHQKYQFKFGWLSRVYKQLGVSSPNAHAWRESS